MLKILAVALGTLATPLSPPLDGVISPHFQPYYCCLCNQETKHWTWLTARCTFKGELIFNTSWCTNCGLWDRCPFLCPWRHDACWCTSHSLLMQRYYQHSMDQAVMAASWESRCCREDLCWPHSRPGIIVLWACNDHPRALLDEVCIMGRFLSLKDESMWHEEENFQPISSPDYPTTYSSLIACCVS